MEYAYNPSANIITSDNQDWHIELIPANDWKAIRGSSSMLCYTSWNATRQTIRSTNQNYRYLEVIPLSDGMWQVSEKGETIAYDSFLAKEVCLLNACKRHQGKAFLMKFVPLPRNMALSYTRETERSLIDEMKLVEAAEGRVCHDERRKRIKTSPCPSLS
jgi:hypothetical protein